MATTTLDEQRHLNWLQERFIRSGFDGLNDEEIIELLLSLVLPWQECERQARECVERFTNLRGLLAASAEELQQIGLTFQSICGIRLLHELPTEILKQKIIEQPVNTSSKQIFDYLYYSMRDLEREIFRVIYLNVRNQIIDTADLFEGTLESIPIRPREIVEGAIHHNAVSLIFVHNHPSGDPTPSRRDEQLTRDLVFVGNILQIKVLDHIIIGANRYFSFADEKLIEKYEDDFLNLRIKALVEKSKNYPT
jgi:DNA repair protein RadC